jgi:hypothetical protein
MNGADNHQNACRHLSLTLDRPDRKKVVQRDGPPISLSFEILPWSNIVRMVIWKSRYDGCGTVGPRLRCLGAKAIRSDRYITVLGERQYCGST